MGRRRDIGRNEGVREASQAHIEIIWVMERVA